MHGWRCQESSSHSDCLFHPPWKLTWRRQCHYFPSGFLLEWVCKRCREMNPWVTTPWDAAGTSPSSQAPCAGWGSGQGKLRMLQTRFIYWMRVRNMVCIQTHVWDGVKKPDSTAQTLSCGNQWLLGHWPWQATLHSTVGPGKGCGSQKLFQIRATFPNSNPKKKKPISMEQGRQSSTRQLLVGFWCSLQYRSPTPYQ